MTAQHSLSDAGSDEDHDGNDEEPPPTPVPSSTAVLFANTAPVLVVGDSAGFVTCYRIKGMGDSLQGTTREDQVKSNFLAYPLRRAQVTRLKAAMFPENKA